MDEIAANDESVIDDLEEVWASVVEACEGLDDGQWALPTDCPGWSVKDQVSHLIGIEKMLLGDPQPEPVSDLPPHVKNAFGEINEAWIDVRRASTGPDVLAEFIETTGRRIAALRAMSAASFDVIGWSPVGEVPYREFMGTRVLDSWAHEQDIRRAVGRPGGREGAGEAIALDRCERAMPFVVGKKVSPPDGTLVLFAVSGSPGRRIPVGVEGGRATIVRAEVIDPTTTITMDQETFWRLSFGRMAPEHAMTSGEVTIDGDLAIGRDVVGSMAFMI